MDSLCPSSSDKMPAVLVMKFAGTGQEFYCMLRYLCYITSMARGESGRIVIEVEPELKRQLYSALALSGSTLKDWFLKTAADFCANSAQPSLFTDKNQRPSVGQPSLAPSRASAKRSSK